MSYKAYLENKAEELRKTEEAALAALWRAWPDLQSEANATVLISFLRARNVPVNLESLKAAADGILHGVDARYKLIQPKSQEEVAQYEADRKEREVEATKAERQRLLDDIVAQLQELFPTRPDLVQLKVDQGKYAWMTNEQLTAGLQNLVEGRRLRGLTIAQLQTEAKANFPEPKAHTLPERFTADALKGMARADIAGFKRLVSLYGTDAVDARMGVVKTPDIGVLNKAEVVIPVRKNTKGEWADGLPASITAEILKKSSNNEIREYARKLVTPTRTMAESFKLLSLRLQNRG